MSRQNDMVSVLKWKNDLPSYKKMIKAADDLKYKLKGIADLTNKNASVQFKASQKAVKGLNQSERAAHAFRKEQTLLDRQLDLTEQQTQQLKNKLANLNAQFLKGKLDTKSYNYEISRTTKYYTKLSQEAKRAAKEQAKLDKGMAKGKSSFSAKLGTMFNPATIAAGVGAALTAGISAGIRDSLQRNRELVSAFAKSGETDIKTFQNFAAANSAYGISTDQSGDILKDVTERIGEYLRSEREGGGEGEAGLLIKLMRKTYPELVTNAKLQTMTGTEFLSLAQKTFVQNKIGHKEQVSYLEDLANDSSLLLKSMRIQGAMSQVRERYGLNNSASDMAALSNLGQQTSIVAAGWSRLMDKLTIGFSKESGWVGNILQTFQTLQPVFETAGTVFAGVLTTLTGALNLATNTLMLPMSTLKGILTGDWEAAKLNLTSIVGSLDTVRQMFISVENVLLNLFKTVGDRVRNALDTFKEAIGWGGSDVGAIQRSVTGSNPWAAGSGYGAGKPVVVKIEQTLHTNLDGSGLHTTIENTSKSKAIEVFNGAMSDAYEGMHNYGSMSY